MTTLSTPASAETGKPRPSRCRSSAAEDSDAIVLRLYEAHGRRGVARVRLELLFERALRASAFEHDGPELALDDGGSCRTGRSRSSR